MGLTWGSQGRLSQLEEVGAASAYSERPELQSTTEADAEEPEQTWGQLGEVRTASAYLKELGRTCPCHLIDFAVIIHVAPSATSHALPLLSVKGHVPVVPWAKGAQKFENDCQLWGTFNSGELARSPEAASLRKSSAIKQKVGIDVSTGRSERTPLEGWEKGRAPSLLLRSSCIIISRGSRSSGGTKAVHLGHKRDRRQLDTWRSGCRPCGEILGEAIRSRSIKPFLVLEEDLYAVIASSATSFS